MARSTPQNGNGTSGNGSGILVATGASGLLLGSISVDGNGHGILATAGKLLVFGNVSATNNSVAGLHVLQNGTLRLMGSPNVLDDNVFGARAHGSFLQLFNATFSGNTSGDANLNFGTKAIFRNSPTTSVFCDAAATILIEARNSSGTLDGSVACP